MGWTLMSWRMWRWGMLYHDLQLLAHVLTIYQLSCTASLLEVHLIFSTDIQPQANFAEGFALPQCKCRLLEH